ncbi:flagellin protein [Oceanicola granulosus HTCC2516]|uniref:Flagellin n=1 Tax=Oceanicola granulosus (strain ATCC BAA-861 / DSM 15982 / KCTC 12143 / HTCC2516) TaxID=314256 RepID=Q2CDG6_OCEGH|nr:flagellin [Oceanicola granulosus]EAR50745.1 flagellin protein [Oceanicola granulosus HTCC2516]
MSSILTNNGAMVALQTLKTLNQDLSKTQSMISTGKAVATAKDNSAVWAISKVMESDVQGFKAISNSLALGESTVSVARQASETVTDLLTQMKNKIVDAQADNVDRSKIQDDVQALTDQIKSVVGAAQFNGLNLVNGSSSDFNTNGNVGTNILSSLDRDNLGGVTVSNIGVDAQNLSTTTGDALTAATNSVATLTENGGASDTTQVALGSAFLDASGGATGTTALKSSDAGVDTAVATGLVEGDVMRLKIGNIEGSYVVREGDTADAVLSGLKNGLMAAGLDDTKFNLSLGSGTLDVENLTSDAGIGISLSQERGTGALAQLATLDVSTKAGAETALSNIEGMIQSATNAASAFGSVQSRVETQASFVSDLTNSLKSGIGALVDADMEETSARLQALQVQQQLGVQALSIANQAPQSILSLFR